MIVFKMIAKTKIFRIDEVIHHDNKRKRAFVKWSGYSDQFNSWVPMSELNKLQMPWKANCSKSVPRVGQKLTDCRKRQTVQKVSHAWDKN